MPSTPSKQTSFGKWSLQPKPKRAVMEKRPRILNISLAALAFFLGQTVSVSLIQSNHVGENGKSLSIFSSAFAGKENGKGKGKGLGNGNGIGKGNGNGLGNTVGNTVGAVGNSIGGSNGSNSGGLGNPGGGGAGSGQQKTLSSGLPLPPGMLKNGNVNSNAAPSSTSQGAYVRSLNPINQIPEFEADDEDLLPDGSLALDAFDASGIDYLEEFSADANVQGSSSEAMTGVSLSVDMKNQANGEISVNPDHGQGTKALAIGKGNGNANLSASAKGNGKANTAANASAKTNSNSNSGNSGLALGLQKQANDEIAVKAKGNGNGNGNSGNNGLALGLVKQANGEIAVNANGNGVQARLDVDNNGVQAGLAETAETTPEEAGKNNSSSGSIYGPDGPPDTYSPNEVLAENLDPAAKERARTLGFKVEEVEYGGSGEADNYGRPGYQERHTSLSRLTVPDGMTVPQARDILQRELPGQNFHLNRIYRMFQPAIKEKEKGKTGIDLWDPDDKPCANDRCYGRQAIQWKDDLGKCAGKLKIGIIDTHVDTKHKAFAGQKIHQMSFVAAGRQVAENGHGTSVLGLLAGRPDSNTPGLIPEAEFYVASIFFIGSDGSVQTDTVTLLKAMHWMDRSGVQLINLSFSGPKDSLLEIQFGKLRNEAGMVFAAAAGNGGLAAGPSYPAAYSDVIAVTAVDEKKKIFVSANRGEYIDIAAPGVHIWTALPDSRAGYVSGTSFAAPFMTAMLAIQQPETLRLRKDALLNQIQTVPLDRSALNDSLTYGRGLLQAPVTCPTAPSIAKGWAPVTDVSLK